MERPTRRMLWRLALKCSEPHPDFLPPLSPLQLAEAMAFYQIEPWGPERDELHAAMICMAVASPWSKRRIRLDDFRLKFGMAKPKPKSLDDKIRALAIAFGADGA